ncbi:hypothetical protein SEA_PAULODIABOLI_324 [Microbacterium phage PauloDiaboli]|nr:hypothetical protein SEA_PAULODIABOLI_324 [Microbacterium phage PauloDiaboli]
MNDEALSFWYEKTPAPRRRESLYAVLAGEPVNDIRIFLEIGKVNAEGVVPEGGFHYYRENGRVKSWVDSDHSVAVARALADEFSKDGYHAQVLRVVNPGHHER